MTTAPATPTQAAEAQYLAALLALPADERAAALADLRAILAGQGAGLLN